MSATEMTDPEGVEPRPQDAEPESAVRPTAEVDTDDTEPQEASNGDEVHEDGWPGIS
ncbi:hypothetical protein [Streptomyces beihaiensis]|uniref:Uncharacterized protein n=1 Tax=Streptomyces beihaiensis TaxID=2984495 RepID=A0ABT3TPA2_9ACTN|nr:hypothetical protein [Streptomyces beihaiensis]MCX3058287.1 hypothetical protein [Streptomyces beihaiensis]